MHFKAERVVYPGLQRNLLTYTLTHVHASYVCSSPTGITRTTHGSILSRTCLPILLPGYIHLSNPTVSRFPFCLSVFFKLHQCTIAIHRSRSTRPSPSPHLVYVTSCMFHCVILFVFYLFFWYDFSVRIHDPDCIVPLHNIPSPPPSFNSHHNSPNSTRSCIAHALFPVSQPHAVKYQYNTRSIVPSCISFFLSYSVSFLYSRPPPLPLPPN